MANLQQPSIEADNTSRLTYRYLAAVSLVVFLLWLAGLIFLEPDPYALYILVGIILIAVTLGAGSGAREPKATVKGSTEDVEFLKELPETFHVFMNVSIGVRTNLDAVVVGANGVFIVDVKTRSGKIEPMPGSDWIRHKVGSKGTPYRVPMKNPLQQMKRDIRELQSYLASFGVRPWIDGSVYFTRAEFEEQIDGCYTSSEDILRHIKDFPDDHPLAEEEQKTVAEALAIR